MAEFKKLIVTKKGQELLTDSITSSNMITFSKIKTSSKIYEDESIEELEELEEIKQENDVTKVEKTSGNTIQIETTITNENLKEPYNMTSIGLYANNGGENILYAVSSVNDISKSAYMPAKNGDAISSFYVKLTTIVTNMDNITITINPAGIASVEEVNKLKEEVSNVKENIPKGTSDLTNDANFVDKNVNDLINYYNKENTYQKSEVDGLVSAIKSWHIDVVTELPTQEISTSTIYLISQDNAVSTGVVKISGDQLLLSENKVITTDAEFNINSNKKLTISPIKVNTDNVETKGIASIALPAEEYYLACIYISEDWRVIGTTKVDLSGYAKKEEIPTKLSELTNDLFVKVNSEEEAIEQSASDTTHIYYWIEE